MAEIYPTNSDVGVSWGNVLKYVLVANLTGIIIGVAIVVSFYGADNYLGKMAQAYGAVCETIQSKH